MYGTVMIGRPANASSFADGEAMMERFRAERQPHIKGFVDQWVLQADDGRIVTAVRFESKAAYDALADDPEQDRFYREVMRPLLAEDPQWIDGEWTEYS